MSQTIIHVSPVFVPGPRGSGTLDFTGMGLDVRDIWAVYNLTKGGICIYSNNTPGFGAQSIAAGPILTLNVDTSTCANTDLLTVVGDASGGGGGGGSSVDRELVTTTYYVKTAFSGASVGDTITCTQVLDVSLGVSTVSTVWRNQTTAADLGSTPSGANLSLVGATALTDAQLRATPVPVSLSGEVEVKNDVGNPLYSQIGDVVVTNTVTAGQTSTVLTLAGRAGVGVVIAGLTGSCTVEGTVDGSLWGPVSTSPQGGGPRSQTITANGAYEAIGAGLQAVRINNTGSTTITFTLLGTAASRIVRIWSTDAANVLATVNLRDGSGNPISATSGDLNVALRGRSLADGSQQPLSLNPSGALFTSNTRDRFRDAFNTKNGSNWTYPAETPTVGNTWSRIDGNVAGESYLVVSLPATTATGVEWVLNGIPRFVVPYEVEFGATLSQRIWGQEVNVELVGVDSAGNVLSNAVPSAVAVTSLVSTGIATSTLNTAADVDLKLGDYIYTYGFNDARCNQQQALVTAVGGLGLNPKRTFTITTTATIPSGTYTTGTPMIRRIDHTGGARYCVGNRYFSTTTTGIDLISINNDPRPRLVTLSAGTAALQAVIPNEGGQNYATNSGYTQAFRTAFAQHIEHTSKRILWRSRQIDVTATDNSSSLRRMPVPLHETADGYILRVRLKNLESFSIPGAPILRAEKQSASTAKITQTAHGLTTNDFLVIFGGRDSVNFANAATLAQVTIANANDFTITWGATSTTATTAGGFWAKVPGFVSGGAAPTSFIAANTQSYNKTTDGLRVVLVAAANWPATVIVGDTVTLYGLVETSGVNATTDGIRQVQWEGRYRVALISTTSLELEPLEGQDLTAMSSTAVAAGCGVIKNTDLRLHYARVYDRSRIEVDSSKQGHSNEPDPVTLVSAPATVTVTATNLSCNVAQVGGTNTVNGGLAGTLAVGGAAATGTAPTTNPNLIAGVDGDGFTRPLRTTVAGGVTGLGELQYPGFAFTNGAATPTEGVSCRTFAGIAGRNCLLELGVTAQGNAGSTLQVEGSFDGQTFCVIPLSRVESFANNQYLAYSSGAASTAFAPVNNSTYQGRTYGYPIIRVHEAAFTTTGTTVTYVRLMPLPTTQGEQVSPFTLDAQNTTEAAGTAAGALMSGGVRTLPITTKGNAKAVLELDGFTYATAAPTSSTLVVEGLQGGVWTALPLVPLGGGAQVTSITSVGALPGANNNAFLSGRWEADVTGMASVRVRWSAYTAGTATNARYHGALKVIPVAGTASYKPTYAYRQAGIAATTTTNVLGIEAGAAKSTVIKRLIVNGGTATAATLATLTLNRETTAGTTNAVTPTAALHNRDANDAVFSGILRSSGFAAGTNAATSLAWDIPVTATGTVNTNTVTIDLTNGGQEKGIVIPAGTANGAMFVFGGTAGGAGLSVTAEWTEE